MSLTRVKNTPQNLGRKPNHFSLHSITLNKLIQFGPKFNKPIRDRLTSKSRNRTTTCVVSEHVKYSGTAWSSPNVYFFIHPSY